MTSGPAIQCQMSEAPDGRLVTVRATAFGVGPLRGISPGGPETKREWQAEQRQGNRWEARVSASQATPQMPQVKTVKKKCHP